jgi:hypothetical protein
LSAQYDGVDVLKRVWEGRWLAGPLTYGVWVGLVVGAGQWAVFGSAAQGIGTGLLTAVVVGGFMARWRRRVWPRGGQLSSSDRAAVVRAVRHGERVPDPRLGPEVLAYASVVGDAAERSWRDRWALWLCLAMTSGWAAYATVAGQVRSAAYWWVLTAACLAARWRMPRVLEQRRSNAAEAARQAGQHIYG